MFFDQMLERVRQRINEYKRSSLAGTVFSEEALAEAANLWQVAQPADTKRPTPIEKERLALAQEALGWLHLLRLAAHPHDPNALLELARTVVYLAPVAHSLSTIPEPLQSLLVGADPSGQAECADNMLSRARVAPEPVFLDAGILLLSASIVGLPADHVHRVASISNLAAAYRVRFERDGVWADLDKAIEVGDQGAAEIPQDHPNRVDILSNLSGAYRVRFERGGVLSDLDRAIDLGEQAVAATPQDRSGRGNYLSNLAFAYRVRFERGGVLSDLDRAIDLGEQAVAATPQDHSDRGRHLSNLNAVYQMRFERCGVLSDLDRAIDLGEQAVVTTHQDKPNHAGMSNLSGAYRVRFERGGVWADLDKAIDLGEQAVAATPQDHPDRGMYLSNLGATYRVRFERGGVLSDLDRAIELGKQAARKDKPNHGAMSNLSGAYRVRFERGGVWADLDKAIDLGEQAVAATPQGHPEYAVSLSNIAFAYRVRFERGGVLSDLDRAVDLGEQAVAATPQDHPDRGMYLSNLSGVYQLRFERGGVFADLDNAIDLGEQAVAATPQDHPDRGNYLSNLGLAYRVRFERGGVLSDLDKAVDLGEQAVAATPQDYPNRANYLSILGAAYRVRFERGGVLSDLDKAVDLGEQAVAATPQDHPDRGNYLSNLGAAYHVRFDHDGVWADLDSAIEKSEQAVAATANDHPNRAAMLSNLGTAYQARLDVGGKGVDRPTLLMLAHHVTAADSASPARRVFAGRVVGSLAHAANEDAIAVELLDAAVRLVPSVTPREAAWEDQEHSLGEHHGLVPETVAAHCGINDPVGAVEASELGRGILLAAQLESRSDLTDLDNALPKLSAEFRRVRSQLNTSAVTRTEEAKPLSNSIVRIEHRKRLWAEHDQILAQIRQHPGFGRFLLPPRLADLQPATAGGAAILVNSGRRRSDAIIITAHADPVHVPLTDAVPADVSSQTLALVKAIHDDSLLGTLRRQRVVPEILGWLWDTVVEPALNALPPTGDGKASLPRVWWLPTGLLGLFPLHAAGHLGRPGALDAAVSSYTPTLRSLAHARVRPPATVRRQLTVALRHTPGLPALPGTVAEATDLHVQHPDTPFLLDEAATTSRVLAALPGATWAHFACHASADLAIPSQGGLVLHDATVALPEISQLHLGQAELAYLSACSTADRGVRLADESLHLASAFQLAGFRHVIASLWPLNDSIAATAAASVYRRLPETPTADQAATALHHVACELREEHPGDPGLWAALIHSGP